MAKYIDIDKAQLEFYKAHEGDEFTPNIITLQTFLLYYPPADVRPVVRGVWRFEKQGPEDYEQFWRCSVCADKTYFITNYCHNCGADMRGGDADGEEKD